MCGIFGYIGKEKEAAEIVFKGLRSLEYRGYDSFGILAKKKDGSLFLNKETGPLPKKTPSFPQSSFAFGHTRWATHGGVKVKNAHPQFDCQRKIFVIHNGIVENFESLKKELIRRGHKFVSQTDTEVIPHLIEEKIKKFNLVEATRQAFLKLDGLNAVVVASSQDEAFVCAKNISPISIGKKGEDIYFASDPNALAEFTNKVHFLKDDHMVAITKSGVELFDLSSRIRQPLKFEKYTPVVFEEKEKKYPHFMLKEIFEQPLVLERLIKNKRQIGLLADQIKKCYGAFFIGSGSAGFAALFGTYIFSKIAKRHVNFSFSSEFSYYKNFLTDKSLVIAFSQSGETADVISAVKSAREKKARIAACTNVFGSTLYRTSDIKVLLEAGPERCVLATKSFMAKLAVLLILASYCSRPEVAFSQVLKQVARELTRMKKEPFLKKIRRVVKVFYRKSRLFVVGRGANYPIACEAALKIKEGSYLHAEGLAGGELKHGVIALIEKGTPCIILAPNDETYGDILSNAMELKSRGGYIIGLGSKKSEVFDEFVKIKDLGAGSYLLTTFAIQLFGYYTATLRGLNPDRPRNLAKSVTVK